MSDSRLVTEEVLPGGSPTRTPVERLLSGDWRTAAIVAGPTILVAYVLGLVGTAFLIWVNTGGDESFDPLAHSNAGFFRSAFALTGMAFGSPDFLSGRSGNDHLDYQAGMAPLTITLLTAVAFVFLLRRYDAFRTFAERLDLALRAAVLTAIGLALLTIGMFATIKTENDSVHQSGSPGRVFGWSLLLFAVTALVASVRRWDLAENIGQLWERWRLPILGAVVAMTTAIVVGGVTGILIFLAQADSGRLDVLKALPTIFIYLVNLGVDVFQVSMGGALHASAGSGGSSLSLFNRHGLSAAYFFLLLLPPLAIITGINWIRNHAGESSRLDVVRACYRMALPAALLYLLLAVPSRAGFAVGSGETGFGGSGHAGVQVLLGTVIVFGWFAVVGYVIGQFWLPPTPGRGGATPQPPRLPAWTRGSVAAGPLAIVAGVLGVLIAAGGAATAKSGAQSGDLGPVSGIAGLGAFATSDGSVEEGGGSSGTGAVAVPATPVPTFTVGPESDQAGQDLRDWAAAEEAYFAQHQSYTVEPALLPSVPGVSPTDTVTIARADNSSYCLEAITADGQAFTYDSDVRLVTPGATC